MTTETRASTTQRITCPRCGGYALPDVDGDLVCLICSRPLHPRRPVVDRDESAQQRNAA